MSNFGTIDIMKMKKGGKRRSDESNPKKDDSKEEEEDSSNDEEKITEESREVEFNKDTEKSFLKLRRLSKLLKPNG
jgi:hypothetical protein